MLLSFVQEETIAKEILEVNSKYADLISKEGGINEEITTNWTTEITNIQLKWGQHCVDTAWRYRINHDIKPIMTYGFSKAKEEIKMAVKIRFRGLQKTIPLLNNGNLHRRLEKIHVLAWWPSNIRVEI